jgi:hypothetical protein
MSENKTGSCKCSEVKYEIKSEVEMVANCHCNTCRKMSGAAFATIVVVDEQSCEIFAGRNEMTAYQVTDNVEKHFCRKCGTPVYYLNKKFPGKCLIPIGSLDNPTGLKPSINVFCESMLPWVSSIDEITSFDQLPG